MSTVQEPRVQWRSSRSIATPHPVIVDGGILTSEDQVAGGMWPTRFALWTVAVYVALFILRPWEELMPSLRPFHIERIYALFMVGMVLYSSRIRPRLCSQSLAALLFLVAVTLSAILAWDPLQSEDRWYGFVVVVIFYFILRLAVRTPYELVFIVMCYVATVATYLAKAQWEFFINDRRDHTMGVIRLIGFETTFGGPNALAMSIVTSLPFAYFLFTERKRICAGWRWPWPRLFLAGLGAYAFLASSSIVLTNSRSGMLSGMVFVALAALRGKSFSRKLLAGIAGVVLLAILWMFMSDASKNRLRTVWDPQSASADTAASSMGRIEGLKAGLKMFQTFPATGVGVGNFIPYRVGFLDGVGLDPHNIVGQVLGETGAVGAMAFALFVLVIITNCAKIKRRASRQAGPVPALLSAFALACQNTLFLLFFEGLFFHNLLRFNWLWLAAFSSLAVDFAYRRWAVANGSARHSSVLYQ